MSGLSSKYRMNSLSISKHDVRLAHMGRGGQSTARHKPNGVGSISYTINRPGHSSTVHEYIKIIILTSCVASKIG